MCGNPALWYCKCKTAVLPCFLVCIGVVHDGISGFQCLLIISVVTMLLNTKSHLIATKQLVFFCSKMYEQPVPLNVFVNGVFVQFSGQVNFLVHH